MEMFSNYIAELLAEHKFIVREQIEVCKYGIENLLTSALEILSILFLSVFLNNTIFSMVFMVSFISLRRYTGGYHANTKMTCYIIFIGAYIIFTVLLRYFPEEYIPIIGIITILFTWFMILKYAPIVNKNKTVGELERRIYKKYGIVLTFIWSLIIIIGIVMNLNVKFVLSIVSGLMVVSLSMLVSKLTERG